jgi:hypothetical protein
VRQSDRCKQPIFLGHLHYESEQLWTVHRFSSAFTDFYHAVLIGIGDGIHYFLNGCQMCASSSLASALR